MLYYLLADFYAGAGVALMKKGADSPTGLRYEADEKPPTPLVAGLGLQLALLIVGSIVLTPAIVVRAAGGTESYLSWAVFAAVAIGGISTIMQAVRFGRFGAGYVLAMGTSGAFIAICVAALAQGGPAMLATLVLVSALLQFILATRLSLLRRILTPTVTGTVIMLIPVSVMSIIFEQMTYVPDGSSMSAVSTSVLVTLLAIAGITLTATGAYRLWAPFIGVVVGSVVAGFYGLYDVERVLEASWIGLPEGAWPGIDLSFGPVFWALLPGFVVVTLVGATETIGDAIAVQRISWHRPRAVDFRSVQGAVSADGMGNLLSGLAATVPNTTYSISVAVTELTGVASRHVGIALGLVFVIIAFLPKALAVVLAIPGSVAAAYIAVLLAMLFVLGMKIVVQDGIDYRQSLIAGAAFWVGVGFQNGLIFPEYFAGFAGGLLENGMTAGGLVAILLTLFLEWVAPRRHRKQVPLEASALSEIGEFVATFASQNNMDDALSHRLDAVSEEAFTTLVQQNEEKSDGDAPPRNLLLIARKEAGGAVLEFIVAPGEKNIEDRIALLGRRIDKSGTDPELSLRLLRHFASSVHHQQYHDTDIVTVRVDPEKNI